MKKKITIEINGLNNSARAINNNSINKWNILPLEDIDFIEFH